MKEEGYRRIEKQKVEKKKMVLEAMESEFALIQKESNSHLKHIMPHAGKHICRYQLFGE